MEQIEEIQSKIQVCRDLIDKNNAIIRFQYSDDEAVQMIDRIKAVKSNALLTTELNILEKQLSDCHAVSEGATVAAIYDANEIVNYNLLNDCNINTEVMTLIQTCASEAPKEMRNIYAWNLFHNFCRIDDRDLFSLKNEGTYKLMNAWMIKNYDDDQSIEGKSVSQSNNEAINQPVSNPTIQANSIDFNELDKDTQIKNYQNKVLMLRRKTKFRKLDITVEELTDLAGQNRKKNHSINFSKLSKIMGHSNHTITAWCKEYGIK